MTFCCHVFNLEQTFASLILKRSTNVDRKQFPSRVSQVSIFLHFTHRRLLRKQSQVSFSVCTFGATYFCSTDLSMVCNPQNRLIPFVSPFENDFPVVPAYGTSQVALVVKNPTHQWRRHKKCGFQSLGRDGSLEEGMAIHSRILAWRIPWTEEPGRLWSIGLQRFRHD